MNKQNKIDFLKFSFKRRENFRIET